MNYLIKGWKYLMFVGIREVDYLVDKLRFISIIFIYYFIYFIYFIDLFISFNANFIISRRLLINEMLVLSNPSLVRIVLMSPFSKT